MEPLSGNAKMDVLAWKMRIYWQSNYVAKLRSNATFREAVCDALNIPAEARARAGNDAAVEICPLCGMDKGSLRHYQLSCPHPALVFRDAQRAAVHEKLMEHYDPAHGPVDAQPSVRLDRSTDYEQWPLLRREPFLLRTCEGAVLLQPPAAGGQLESATDLMYRGVFPKSLMSLLRGEQEVKVEAAQRVMLTILVYAHRMRRETQLALGRHFASEFDKNMTARRASKSAAAAESPALEVAARPAPARPPLRCSGPLCAEAEGA